ncbi:flagellar assembly protein T N-terminal domain-containing protein [Marinobacteraceae bacterium S3BR75-40.1]
MTRLSPLLARMGLLVLFVVLWAPAGALAQWITGVGQAAIVNNNVEAAREEARRNALRDAALQFEARIASEETVENGSLKQSKLTVASRAHATRIRILSQQRYGNTYRVNLEADMTAGRACGQGDTASYRKRVAVTGFAVVHPKQAALGRLFEVQRAIPEGIYATLQESGGVQPFSVSDRQVYADALSAPTHSTTAQQVTKTLELAQDLDVQFVVSGIVRDMGVVDQSAWGDSVLDKLQSGLGLTNRNRKFVMDVVVHDGFSGAPVFERRYQTEGEWTADREADLRLGTPEFAATPYGRKVDALIHQAAQDINHELSCQPFMTRITRVEGKKVYLASGAASGLRPGDALQLYRRYDFIDLPGSQYELQPTESSMRVTQVHPEFSNGVMAKEAGRLNIQRGDIAIIW